MALEYESLLELQRQLYSMPLNRTRFEAYLRMMLTEDRSAPRYPPLVAINPMGKGHCTQRIEQLLALDADGIARQAVADFAAMQPMSDWHAKISLVLVDDQGGGWTNRVSTEYGFLTGGRSHPLPEQWLLAPIWTRDIPTPESVRQAVLVSALRTVWQMRHGLPGTLRELMDQEGWARQRAGCTTPGLDAEDGEYTQLILRPEGETRDPRAQMELLFGDRPCQSLGFTPRGLSPFAGLAVALAEARGELPPTWVTPESPSASASSCPAAR
ncbi:hypothetical protein [Tuwongella immobilis]|uniref:Uncharacterized protein n=1 Tax=Tuwongella immobilis TaxID=692036 RepID=A0A6C2YK66_9BACT|nr:hypothetical protein [Tuwongella immobilis]VIP01691.1 Uncharacterized protein OS=Leptolyngbya sp. Heron Island J GN=N836_05420 PE=4 SV=1 [Tuwongella immobilis]VTR99161.1 Uncharacterized protein OS=Leptolyngbya sp. Heron Island J GN=N836_05420 PE=4 SV=1 [Tuwongella immobilis]